MSKIALVTDSTSYLPDDFVKENDVRIIPLSVIFGSEVYKEGIELDASAFYKKLKDVQELPTTSQPPAGEFVSVYEQLEKEGYDEAIVICLSSGLSGTFNTAKAAAEMVEKIKVHVFDSEIAALAEGFYVIEAAKMIKEGATSEAILQRLTTIRDEHGMNVYLVVDDLTNLHRGGRMTGAQALLGSLLQIKPILTFKDKKIGLFEKVRTKKKALARMLELFSEDAKTGAPIRASIITAEREEEAQAMIKDLAATYPNIEIDTGYLGAVVGTHGGEGLIGLVWYRK
ncbi:DegV family protein [Pullulanibacillus sp. KACC 23026]|uniref:DegV family protein n=1 Tax=Pullulanibacillus sp. KACC 23026 TaxID=3028315 RepID=UPI0023AFA998|nr:DegV family protein [Pullulanibacillus sp. KACC 23026]WEG13592.1 DegV family protein [Pullulanibacillus sp. KACC 23026]